MVVFCHFRHFLRLRYLCVLPIEIVLCHSGQFFRCVTPQLLFVIVDITIVQWLFGHVILQVWRPWLLLIVVCCSRVSLTVLKNTAAMVHSDYIVVD